MRLQTTQVVLANSGEAVFWQAVLRVSARPSIISEPLAKIYVASVTAAICDKRTSPTICYRTAVLLFHRSVPTVCFHFIDPYRHKSKAKKMYVVIRTRYTIAGAGVTLIHIHIFIFPLQ